MSSSAATVTAAGVTVGYGAALVFADLDLVVEPGARIGLVGANGAGKSTLLRVLAGLQPVETGRVIRSPADATVGYLPQEPDRRPGESLLDYLRRRTGVQDAESALERAGQALADAAPGAADDYQQALDRYLALGGPDLDVRAAAVAADLGLAARLDASTTALSGGQVARAALAVLLLARFDLFCLDEPTNDLDLDGLARLEEWVAAVPAAVVVVSHDRAFLDRTVTSVVELDRANGQVRRFAGGWTAYLREREVERARARDAYDDYATRRQELVDRARRQRESSRSGALRAARRAPDNDRAQRAGRIESAESAARAVRAIERRIEQLEPVTEPRKEWELRLTFGEAARSGELVAELRGAVVHRGGFRLGPVDVDLRFADRVAILGANGSGKTTLLDALLGRAPLAAGDRRLGSGVVVGELDQSRHDYDTDAPVVEVVGERTGLQPEPVRTLLAKFGLGADDVARPARSLSPGERTRAALAVFAARGTNCLVLDEPTNHLDLPAIEQLEAALAGYRGTLLVVTHDRRLLAGLAVDRRWLLDDGQLTEQLA